MTVALVLVAELLLAAVVVAVAPPGLRLPAALVVAACCAVPLLISRVRAAVDARVRALLPGSAERSPDAVDLVAEDGSFVGCLDRTPMVATALRLTSGTLDPTYVQRDGRITVGVGRTEQFLPWAVLAEHLDQGHARVVGIDTYVRGRRAIDLAGRRVYADLVGPLPLVADREVTVVVRFDLSDPRSGLHARPGGPERTSAWVISTTDRVRRALVHHGFGARILDAHQLADLYRDLDRTAGHQLGSSGGRGVGAGLDQTWDTTDDGVDHVIRLAPSDLPGHVRTHASVLRPPGPEAGRGAPGAFPLLRTRDGWSAADAGGSAGADDVVAADRLREVAIPTHGAGQILGATPDGAAYALLIAGPHLRSVVLAAPRRLSRQVALRAVGSGRRLAIRTDVPGAWQGMVEAVGDDNRLWILTGARSTGAAHPDGVLWDCADAPTQGDIDAFARPDAWDDIAPTVIHVVSPDVDDAYPDFDTALARGPRLVLDGRVGGWLAVERSGAEPVSLRVVDGPGEAHFVDAEATAGERRLSSIPR